MIIIKLTHDSVKRKLKFHFLHLKFCNTEFRKVITKSVTNEKKVSKEPHLIWNKAPNMKNIVRAKRFSDKSLAFGHDTEISSALNFISPLETVEK